MDSKPNSTDWNHHTPKLHSRVSRMATIGVQARLILRFGLLVARTKQCNGTTGITNAQRSNLGGLQTAFSELVLDLDIHHHCCNIYRCCDSAVYTSPCGLQFFACVCGNCRTGVRGSATCAGFKCCDEACEREGAVIQEMLVLRVGVGDIVLHVNNAPLLATTSHPT
jgi:hypothetical protein